MFRHDAWLYGVPSDSGRIVLFDSVLDHARLSDATVLRNMVNGPTTGDMHIVPIEECKSEEVLVSLKARDGV